MKSLAKKRRAPLRNEETRLNMHVKLDARAMRARAQRANMRLEGEICQVAKICQVGCQAVGAQFFLFYQK
jgi:hypothetical protein